MFKMRKEGKRVRCVKQESGTLTDFNVIEISYYVILIRENIYKSIRSRYVI